MSRARAGALILIAAATFGCASDRADAPPSVEARSLLGRDLSQPQIPPERRVQLERDLAEAKAALDADPSSEAAAIWYGRRLAYLGRYREAIDAFSAGLSLSPESYRLYRHRGHRWITLREFDRAIADLTRAAELAQGKPDQPEPDGMPNRLNLPRSTDQTNIYYHLGLAHYLTGDWAAAADALAICLELSPNDDMRTASRYWLYLALRRAGRDAQARAVLEPVPGETDIIENDGYRTLLLVFRGDLPPPARADADGIDQATLGYGLGAWALLNGDVPAAESQWKAVVNTAPWAAFGSIAAEAELARSAR